MSVCGACMSAGVDLRALTDKRLLKLYQYFADDKHAESRAPDVCYACEWQLHKCRRFADMARRSSRLLQALQRLATVKRDVATKSNMRSLQPLCVTRLQHISLGDTQHTHDTIHTHHTQDTHDTHDTYDTHVDDQLDTPIKEEYLEDEYLEDEYISQDNLNNSENVQNTSAHRDHDYFLNAHVDKFDNIVIVKENVSHPCEKLEPKGNDTDTHTDIMVDNFIEDDIAKDSQDEVILNYVEEEPVTSDFIDGGDISDELTKEDILSEVRDTQYDNNTEEIVVASEFVAGDMLDNLNEGDIITSDVSDLTKANIIISEGKDTQYVVLNNISDEETVAACNFIGIDISHDLYKGDILEVKDTHCYNVAKEETVFVSEYADDIYDNLNEEEITSDIKDSLNILSKLDKSVSIRKRRSEFVAGDMFDNLNEEEITSDAKGSLNILSKVDKSVSIKRNRSKFDTGDNLNEEKVTRDTKDSLNILSKVDKSVSIRRKRNRNVDGARLACDQCEKTFSQQGRLVLHVRKCHQKEVKPHGCSRCIDSFDTIEELRTHIALHRKREPYTCDLCNKTFSYIKNLRTHMYLHTGETLFSCETCGRGFVNRTTFIRHKQAHTGEAKQKCPICGKICNNKYYLRKHIDRHTEKPVKACEICGKTVVSLKIHMRVHDGRPDSHACKHCPRVYKTRAQLAAHVKAIHEGVRLPCDLCTKTFKFRAQLTAHVMTHAGMTQYCCDKCGVKVSSFIGLGRHKARNCKG